MGYLKVQEKKLDSMNFRLNLLHSTAFAFFLTYSLPTSGRPHNKPRAELFSGEWRMFSSIKTCWKPANSLRMEMRQKFVPFFFLGDSVILNIALEEDAL
jgi:hypothetical protein